MIFSTIKKINLISKRYSFKKWSLFILPFIFISSILEMIGIGLIIPLVNLLLDEQKFILQLNELFGINLIPNDQFIILFFVFIGIFYFIKNFYLIIFNNILLNYTTNFQINLSENLITVYSIKKYVDLINLNSSLLVRNVLKEVGILKKTLLSLLHIFSDGIFLIFIVIFLTNFSFEFIILFATFIFFLITSYIFFFKKKFSYYGARRVKYLGHSLKHLNEYVNALKLIKIFDKNKSIITDFKQTNKIAQNSDKKKSMLMEIIKRLSESLFVVLFLLFLILLIFSGQGSSEIIPKLAVLAASAFRIFPAINRLNMNFQTLRYNSKSTDILYNLFKNEKITKKLDCNFSSIQNIELKNISLKFPKNNKFLFKKLNLKLSKGETIFFVGKSGKGKSSLANIISGLIEPTAGQVYFNGNKIDIVKTDISRMIGYVSQDNYILDTSIKKNIALDSDSINMSKIISLTKKLKLYSLIKHLPNKFNTVLGETGLKISGGQKQRLCIARALYKDPELLIFDEPTSAVDKKNAKNIIKTIHGINDLIKIIITHDEKIIPKRCRKLRI